MANTSIIETSLPEFLIDVYTEYKKINYTRTFPYIDGLKTVQRRIFYALYQTNKKDFVKAAIVVGNTLKYHPHSDDSVYKTLVGMVNKYWVIGKGNWGYNLGLNVEPPAAYRYTEVKLRTGKSISEYPIVWSLLDFVPFIEGEIPGIMEPDYLPTIVPLCVVALKPLKEQDTTAKHIVYSTVSGIGVGYRISLPLFEYESLLELVHTMLSKISGSYNDTRVQIKQLINVETLKKDQQLINKLPIPIKSNSSIANINTDSDKLEIWTSSKFSVSYVGKYEKVKNNVYRIIGHAEPSSLKNALDKLIERGILQRYVDLSADCTNIELVFDNKVDSKRIEKELRNLITYNQSYQVGFHTHDALHHVSLYEYLWVTIAKFLNVVDRKLEHDLNELLRKQRMYELLELIRPILQKELKKLSMKSKKEVVSYFVDKLNITNATDRDIVNSIFDLPLYRILTVKYDKQEIETKIKQVRQYRDNVVKYVLEQF